MVSNQRERFVADWAASIESVAGESPPAHSEWRGHTVIRRALTQFAGQNKNHAHLPTGGGMDVLEVSASKIEADCLELKTTPRTIYLVKPLLLELEYIAGSPHDSFLLLTLDDLKPTGIYEHVKGQEEVFEVEPGDYVDRGVWDQGYLYHDENGYEVPLPDHSRIVVRWLGGKMLFVAKGTLWNGMSETYDGRHNTMSAADIRRFIERELRLG